MIYPKQLRKQFDRLKKLLNDADDMVDNHRIMPKEGIPRFKDLIWKADRVLIRLMQDKYMQKYDEDCRRYVKQCYAILCEYKNDLTLDWNQYDPETDNPNAIHGVSGDSKPVAEATWVTPKIFDDVLTGRRAYKEELVAAKKGEE